MPGHILRFKHLKERGVVNDRVQLHHLITKYGFPPGRKMSPGIRFWFDWEVDGWLESRPADAKQSPRGWHKNRLESAR